MPSRSRRRRSGFTIAEALIVGLIIALLLVVLLPAINPPRRHHTRVAAQAQLAALSTACTSYELVFNAPPGYVPDSSFAPESSSVFTASENLVVCLMGGVVATADAKMPIEPAPPGLPDGRTIDVAQVGGGPRSDEGRSFGPFYSPKADELVAVSGTAGADNNMPELIERKNGTPILYYRIAPSLDGTPAEVADFYTAPARVGRLANGDYLNATRLQSPGKDAFDQSSSLLSETGAGDAATANDNLARILRTRVSGRAGGGFALLSAGDDGVYFDRGRRDETIGDDADLAKFDDIVRTDGD